VDERIRDAEIARDCAATTARSSVPHRPGRFGLARDASVIGAITSLSLGATRSDVVCMGRARGDSGRLTTVQTG
jgi:hypothetical protein